MAKRKLCELCRKASTDPLFRNPRHLVNPQTGELMLFDIHGKAVCPDCGAVWHRLRNDLKLVE